MFGRTYENFEIGDEYVHWPGKTITESDNNLFSLLTMNHHPLHLDVEFAANRQHGKILVVGTYVFSLVVGQSVRDISGAAIANLSYEGIDHLAPSFVGDTIYSKTSVLSKRLSQSKPDRGVVGVETVAWNQNEVDVLRFRRSVLVPVG
jgi:acyl dehydratase